MNIANIIEDICLTLGYFYSIHISHKYREANSVADWFANDVVKRDMVMIWIFGENILAGVKSLIDLEKIQGGTGEIK